MYQVGSCPDGEAPLEQFVLILAAVAAELTESVEQPASGLRDGGV